MPLFFDSNALTWKQKANWDCAVKQYAKVREQHKQQMIANGMPAKEAEVLVSMTFMNPDYPPNMEKSALFARLLEGKAPLPHPPPTSFAYPWYEVVEEDGPFDVLFDGIINPDNDNWAPYRAALINHAYWKVVSENQAAKDLLAGKLDKGIVAANPIIEVENGPWTGYRLVVRRKTVEMFRMLIESRKISDFLFSSVPTEPVVLRSVRPGDTPGEELLACEINALVLEKCDAGETG